MRPLEGTYPLYYDAYIKRVTQQDVVSALVETRCAIEDQLRSVPAARHDFAYAPGKWTVKEIVQHLSDTERILSYRALRFARGDRQQPSPFDENAYVANGGAAHRGMDGLMSELLTARDATVSLFEGFGATALSRSGPTSMGEATVVSIGFMIAGHALHHLQVLRERYR